MRSTPRGAHKLSGLADQFKTSRIPIVNGEYPTWQTSRLSRVFLVVLIMLPPSISVGAYTQQGSKLVGSDAVGSTFQGFSVTLSSNGDTMIVGGYGDNGNVGASWVFTRSSRIWTQQDTKLVGTGAAGIPRQGYSVSLAADGNTALVGGYGDSPGGAAGQGQSVSLSGDSSTAALGGSIDQSGIGATWVFTTPATTAAILALSTMSLILLAAFLAVMSVYRLRCM